MDSQEFNDLTDSYADLPISWMQSIPIISSLMLHLCALSMFAAITLPVALLSDETAIHINAADTEIAAEAGAGDSVSFSGGPFVSEAAISSIPDLMVASQITEGTTDAALVMISEDLPPSPLDARGGLASAVDSMSMSSQLSEGSGLGSGEGLGTGSGGPNARFFKTGDKAKSVVFVIDASKSMNIAFEGRARTRFIRVKQELYSTVLAMNEGERFFIIFFGDASIPMPAQNLVVANDLTKNFFLEWAMRVPADGLTIPEQALAQAVGLQPEVIYFLTDGDFERTTIDAITKLNVHKIPINTIGFNDRRNSNILLDFARKNNGTYTYIPPDYD